MDAIEEAKPAQEQSLKKMQAGTGTLVTGTLVPDEYAERLLSLFRNEGLGDRQEAEIDRQTLNGDPHEQILALYREYRPRLFAYVRSLCLSRDEAEDVIQETFLRLANKLLLNVEVRNVQGWVVHAAHDLAVDVIRRRDRAANRFQETTAFEFESVPDRTSGPEETLLEKEQRQELEAALSRFTPKQRQCFELRSEGFHYKDIGLALGISEQRAALIVKQVTIRLAALCG